MRNKQNSPPQLARARAGPAAGIRWNWQFAYQGGQRPVENIAWWWWNLPPSQQSVTDHNNLFLRLPTWLETVARHQPGRDNKRKKEKGQKSRPHWLPLKNVYSDMFSARKMFNIALPIFRVDLNCHPLLQCKSMFNIQCVGCLGWRQVSEYEWSQIKIPRGGIWEIRDV